jgi:hypothetical protein
MINMVTFVSQENKYGNTRLKVKPCTRKLLQKEGKGKDEKYFLSASDCMQLSSRLPIHLSREKTDKLKGRK